MAAITSTVVTFFGNTPINVPGAQTAETIRANFKSIFPQLTNATSTVSESGSVRTISFQESVGTKGL